jgi:3-dehydroquinate synthase
LRLQFGAIAQLVEQWTENPCVPGSNPGGTTKLTKRSLYSLRFFYAILPPMHTNIVIPIDFADFELQLNKSIQGYSQVVVLTDSNTLEQCWPIIAGMEKLHDVYLLEVPAGEDSKDLDISHGLWSELLSEGMDRSSLLINLGGGMITDLGGFVASVYKRGIDFIHIPTSYLAMVDAAIGGKTGVNFNHLKNQIGTFTSAQAVFIWPNFLQTLSPNDLRSGFAETIKHALIADAQLFAKLEAIEQLDPVELSDTLSDSLAIKCTIVDQDFTERGERQKLNFGHTLGHAIESHAFETEQPLLHGEAIALGMLAALYLSKKLTKFDQAEYERATELIQKHFGDVVLHQQDLDAVLNLVKHDKKNQGDTSRFVLLNSIGEAIYEQEVSEEDMREALNAICSTSV